MKQYLGICIAIFALFSPLAAQTTSPSDIELLAAIQAINAQMSDVQPADLTGVLTRRQDLVSQLIRRNPSLVRGIARTGASALLEQEGEWTGELEVLAVDDFRGHRGQTRFRVHVGTETVDLFLPRGDKPVPQFQSGAIVRVSGFRSGARIAVERIGVQAAAGPECAATGAQKIAVLMVTTPSNAALPAGWDATSVKQTYFGAGSLSLNTYWQDTSYGLASATGQVFGPFALAKDFDCSQLDALRDAALQAASAAVDFTQFSRISLIFPVQSCKVPDFGSIGGLGTVGCSTVAQLNQRVSVAWFPVYPVGEPPASTVGVLAHEHGHNLGLDHANTFDFNDRALGTLDDAGLDTEYGDPFSVMGNADLFDGPQPAIGQYSAAHKSIVLKWLKTTDYDEVQSSGTFNLAPYEYFSGTRALRILRDGPAGSWLWVEYRQPLGIVDSSLLQLSDTNIFGGALIHYESPALDLLHTYLLDFHPASAPNDFYNAALTPGQSWSDPYSLLTLSAGPADSAGMAVTVHYDAPCATLHASAASYASASGAGSIGVTSPPSCAWTISTANTWLTLSGASSGTGNGTVNFSYSLNTSVYARTGFITIQRQSIAITQAGSAISVLSVSPGVTVAASGPVTIVLSDAKGADDIAQVNVSFSGAPSCDLAILPFAKALFLVNDARTAYLGPVISGFLTNSVCSVTTIGTTFSPVGTLLTITLQMTFTPAFAGSHHITATAYDNATGFGTATMGTWTVPLPAIWTLSPAAVAVASGGFTLTVNGSGFLTGAVVQWNGTPLATSFVNTSQLTAVVPASLVTSVGGAAVTVLDPGPLMSNAVSFATGAGPAISSLSAPSITAGSLQFILRVNGSGFVSGSLVRWNGSSLVTTFVNAGQLAAVVPASLLSTVAGALISVSNSGSVVSGAVSFAITAPLSLTSISPATRTAGRPAFTLTATGAGFLSDAIVQWNGSPLPTTVVSSTQLKATVAASLAASPDTVSVTVTQGGGAVAGPLNFIIRAASGAPVVNPGGVVPLGSTVPVIQPGSWISIYGSSLSTDTFLWNNDFPTSLGGTTVTLDGVPAYLWLVSPGQINLQAPDGIASGAVKVVVTTPFGTSSSTVTVARFAPAFILFDARYPAGVVPTPDGSGAFAGGIYDLLGPAGHFAFTTRAVKAGEVLLLYGGGFGPTNPAIPAGQLFSGAAATANKVTVTIGGIPADVQFAGLTGAGLYQFNVVVPAVSSGDQLLQATVGGVQTPSDIFVAVQ